MEIKSNNINDETVLEIGKFAILWNYFENEYCSNYCTPAVIKRKAPSIYLNREKQKKFANVLNERSRWINQLETDYVRTSLHPRNAKRSSEDDMKMMQMFLLQIGNYDELVCGCLLVIRRIRNNMMHGLKAVSELDKQIELFRSANEVLESIRCRK